MTSPARGFQENLSKEMAWLASGLLVLVIGIGGALMYSQEEALLMESAKPVAADELLQAFPSPAMASQEPSPPLPDTQAVLPVSMDHHPSSSPKEPLIKEIEEKEVYFNFDQAVLTGEAQASLNPQAQLKIDHTRSILIRGHTDQKGSEEYNAALSLRRANAVKKYLVSLGHTADSIQVEGLGKTQPVCTESTDACAAQNRRATVYFRKPDTLVATSEPVMNPTASETEPVLSASSGSPTKVNESDPDTLIETVQLSDSQEEIVPIDPIASIDAPD